MHDFAQNIVETVRHPMLLLDRRFRVKLANPAFYRTFKIVDSATKGHPLFDLDDGQWDIPQLRALLEKVGAGGSFADFEVRHDFLRLGHRVMLLNARRVHGDDDDTAMILLAIEDVTEKVRVRDELHQENRQLEDMVRERTTELATANKELEAFCYSVSHDLRAPLRALDGFSNELLRNYSDRLDDKGRHYLQRLRSGTQRMGQLIDDLLQLSRLSRDEMSCERVDLSALAIAVAADLRSQEPTRQVSFAIQPDLFCQGDPGLFRVVLENLLGNAWKFTAKKAAANIAMERTEQQGLKAFLVRDDGAGFDMSHSSKLFGAFQRLHSQQEFPGTGIGLAIVQRVIHRHGGKVWAESLPGIGTTVYFSVPTKETT